MSTLPAGPPARPSLDRCAACGSRLVSGYYTLLDRPERYCPTCIDTRPRCDSCGAPVGPQHWRLHDGRIQCARCHTTAVYDPRLARTLFAETVGGLQQQFGLQLNVGVEFRLVDAPTMDEVRRRGERQPPPVGQRTLGLYQRQGAIRVIYLLYGLPRLILRTTIAHEYAHAWQGEQCPLLRDEELREGFAEWIAYRHLLWLGCDRAARRILTTPHPYRVALQRVLDLEAQLGPAGVIEYIRRAE